MSTKEIKRISYSCSKLGDNAHLVLEYLQHGQDFRALARFNCEDSQKCGVGKEGQRGSWTYNWDACPAYKEISRKRG